MMRITSATDADPRIWIFPSTGEEAFPCALCKPKMCKTLVLCRNCSAYPLGGKNAYSKTRLGVLWLEVSNPFYQTLLTLRVFCVVKRPSE